MINRWVIVVAVSALSAACQNANERGWQQTVILECDRENKYQELVARLKDISDEQNIFIMTRVDNERRGRFMSSLNNASGQVAIVPYGKSSIQIMRQINPFIERPKAEREVLDRVFDRVNTDLQAICE